MNLTKLASRIISLIIKGKLIFLFLLASSGMALAYGGPPPLDPDESSFTDYIPTWLFLLIAIAVPSLFLWIKEKDKEFDYEGCGCSLMVIITVVGFLCFIIKSCF
jgi:hypothetical protein